MIEGKPVPQARPRVVRGRAYYPKGSQDHRNRLIQAFLLEHGSETPVEGPVRLQVRICRPHRGSDLSNHLKMVEDALVDAGVLPEDNVQVVQEVSLEAVWEDSPWTEVTISPL